jgi:hypothetical protein
MLGLRRTVSADSLTSLAGSLGTNSPPLPPNDPSSPASSLVLSPEGLTEGNNYVDITELLTLPQKEAASKLGISESMLCKRFKESTRRKWPYRYVCLLLCVQSLFVCIDCPFGLTALVLLLYCLLSPTALVLLLTFCFFLCSCGRLTK